MTPDTAPNASSLLASKVKVPQHVVYRSFPSETVVLNLETGKYHGLNATAGQMLEALEQAACVRDAAAALAGSYEQAQSAIERDLCELCQALLERGLDRDRWPLQRPEPHACRRVRAGRGHSRGERLSQASAYGSPPRSSRRTCRRAARCAEPRSPRSWQACARESSPRPASDRGHARGSPPSGSRGDADADARCPATPAAWSARSS